MTDVLDESGGDVWHGVCIYGWANQQNKYLIGNLIRATFDGRSQPVVFFGDFNLLLWVDERKVVPLAILDLVK